MPREEKSRNKNIPLFDRLNEKLLSSHITKLKYIVNKEN